MTPRIAAALALVFSGLSALLYQIVWIRLLGLAFGTTSEAIGTVLAVFFGGMALGNWAAARRAARVERPLRVYAWLELGIGVFALATLPLLRGLAGVTAWLGPDAGEVSSLALRLLAAAVLLLPPTVAMGATLPIVARGVVGDDASVGRWSGILYAANTLGAVLGAYLCGFWLIPFLGLTQTVLLAGALNLGVAAFVLFATRDHRVVAVGNAQGQAAAGHGAFLLFFAASGFVAIGYEMVWSKLFGIVMEGTLYGFAAVLSAYLLGIGLGSALIAPFVDRIRDLPRAFGLLHVAIATFVVAGIALVPELPYLHARLAAIAVGADATHALYLVVAPIVVLPAVLFGAAFPVLIRIYAPRAQAVGAGMGRAVAVNTAGSIAASLLLGFVVLPAWGMEATLLGLVGLDLAVGLVVLFGYQTGPPRTRTIWAGAATSVGVAVVALYPGVDLDRTVAGRTLTFQSYQGYREGVERSEATRLLVLEGKNSIVTVSETEAGRALRTNGMPEAGTLLAPPYVPTTTFLLGVAPYLLARQPTHALIVGLGGGNTVQALLETPLPQIEVVELEGKVVEAVDVLYEGRVNPLGNPRVAVRVNDGRNELLRRSGRAPELDVIASQPSHPWLVGAANLFTEEYFDLARRNLAEGGIFALWLNGFRTDEQSMLSVITSFERVFPGGFLLDASLERDRRALLLLGGPAPLVLDLAEIQRRMSAPGLAEALALHGLHRVDDLLGRIEGPCSVFASLAAGAANTDDNAFVEARVPRQPLWKVLDFDALASRLPVTAALLPPFEGEPDWKRLAERLTERGEAARLERLLDDSRQTVAPLLGAVLRARAAAADPDKRSAAQAELERLARENPDRPEPLRGLGLLLAGSRDFEAAAQRFAAAFERSGEARDAYDVARAVSRSDPGALGDWIARIPQAERGTFARLPLFEAQAALHAGRRGESLLPLLDALLAYRLGDEGRTLPGVSRVLADLADAAGRPKLAALHREAARTERERVAHARLEDARTALAEGRLGEAARLLDEANRLLPADPSIADLDARLGVAVGDGPRLDRALRTIRLLAPTGAEAVRRENHLRRELGLPLLPEESAESLVVRRETAASEGLARLH